MITDLHPYRAEIAERRQRVVALTNQGASAAEIAVVLGVTQRAVVRIRHTAGIARDPQVPMTTDELRAAAELLADGCSFNEVGRTLGRSYTTIRHHFPGQGWPPGEGGRLGCLSRWMDHKIGAR